MPRRFIWNRLIGRTKEGDGFPTVEKTMVVCECNDHDGTNDDLAVDDDRSVLDGVHTQHGSLWQVDDGCTVERAEDASVRA